MTKNIKLQIIDETIIILSKIQFPPSPKKHLFKLQLSTQKESQLRDTIVRGFTVALSRSRVVNYSRPKGIEKATSLLRCVRNPTLSPSSPFLSLSRSIG